MTKMLTLFGSAAALAIGTALATPATAQDKPTQMVTRASLTAQLQANFKALDANGDGSIDAKEADAANASAATRAEAKVSAEMDADFTRLDTNKDKQLSLAEFKAMAPKVNPVAAAQSIGRMDSNKDQKLSFSEFSGVPLAAFDRLDTNKDGTISDAERTAAESR